MSKLHRLVDEDVRASQLAHLFGVDRRDGRDVAVKGRPPDVDPQREPRGLGALLHRGKLGSTQRQVQPPRAALLCREPGTSGGQR